MKKYTMKSVRVSKMNNLVKIKGYIGLARKSQSALIGGDNIEVYSKKIHLIIMSDDAGKNLVKNMERIKDNQDVPLLVFTKEEMVAITDLVSCKAIAIKDKGLAEQIIKLSNKE